MSERIVQMERPIYGGAFATSAPTVTLPFVLVGERAAVSDSGTLLTITEASPQRVTPRCPHFGTCGGCQYQMASYKEQLAMKQQMLLDLLKEAGITIPGELGHHISEEYGYRNRIRLRVKRVDGVLHLGYNMRTTTEFLPVATCPIAAPVLWSTAQALLEAAQSDVDVAFWMEAAGEVEVFANDDLSRVQVTLLCAPRTKAKQGSIERCFKSIQRAAPVVAGIGAVANDPRTGPTGRTIAAAGAAGLNYRVLAEAYWVSRGGFFQVNRFLLGELVKLVCEDGETPRRGNLAWDLFAGVGLFSRVLARHFERVVAVESNAAAVADNAAALRKFGPAHEAVMSTTLEFLRSATIQRERPQLIVLDPPRAGAGEEACELLLRIAAERIVYVSCDPTTLARDLRTLRVGYRIARLDLVDLFPQTFHMETVVVLERQT